MWLDDSDGRLTIGWMSVCCSSSGGDGDDDGHRWRSPSRLCECLVRYVRCLRGLPQDCSYISVRLPPRSERNGSTTARVAQQEREFIIILQPPLLPTERSMIKERLHVHEYECVHEVDHA